MRPRAFVVLLAVTVLATTGVLTMLSLNEPSPERRPGRSADVRDGTPPTAMRHSAAPDEGVEPADPRQDAQPPVAIDRVPTPTGPETFDVVIRFPDGVLIAPGTAVAVRDPTTRQLVATVTAGDGGRVRGSGLPRGQLTLHVEAPDGERHHVSIDLRPRMRPHDGASIALSRDTRPWVVIVDLHGEPLPGARLDVLDEKAELIETLRPSDNGEIDWVPPAAATWIVARGPQRATQRMGAPGARGALRIFLRPGHDLAGVVIDESGLPVEGAVVALGSGLHEFKDTTDAQGRFRLTGLEPHEGIAVQVRAKAYAPAFALVTTGREDVEVRLGPEFATGTVRGVVLRPDGSPAAGAMVNLRTECDARGRFVLEEAPAGAGHVSAQFDWIDTPATPHVAREWGVTAIDVPRSGVLSDVTIRLEAHPVSFAVVRVIDENGEGVAGLHVQPPSGWGGITDAEGRVTATVSDTAPGTPVVLTIGAEGRTAEVVTRDVPSGDPRQIVVPPRPRLRVRVIGLPEDAELQVRAMCMAPGGFVGVTLVDDAKKGERTYELLPPPGVRVLVMTTGTSGGGSWVLAPVSTTTRTETLDVRQERKATLDLRSADGSPARDVTAHVTLAHEVPFGRMSVSRFLRLEPGRLVARAVPLGELDVLIYRNRMLAAIVPITMSAAHDPVYRATVPDGQRLTGRVTGNDAAPLGGCAIRLLVPGGHQYVEAQGPLGISDGEGRFEILVPGIDGAALAFVRDGYSTQIVRIDRSLSSRLRRVALRSAGTVRIHGGFVHAIRVPGTDLFWEPEYAQVKVYGGMTTGALIGLPDEEVELDVYIGTERRTRTIHAYPGRTIDLDLRRP